MAPEIAYTKNVKTGCKRNSACNTFSNTNLAIDYVSLGTSSYQQTLT